MKRLVALLLTLLMVFSLSACTFGTKPVAQNATQATEDTTPDISKYKKDFEGMQKYLVDMKLIQATNEDSAMKHELIGAEKGYRHFIDAENFVELYQINTKATPDEAQKLYDTIVSDGTYDVLGMSKLKGVVSDSGNFILLYPASSTYDYSKIIAEFKKF